MNYELDIENYTELVYISPTKPPKYTVLYVYPLRVILALIVVPVTFIYLDPDA